LKAEMQAENAQILVVDDELLIRDLLYDFFTSQGYKVHMAGDGKEAFKIINEVSFQVALVDLKMPEVDGIQVVSELKRKKPEVPIIIMTAFPSMDSAIESIRKGVFNYIVKPFKMTELAETVKSALNEAKYRMERGCT